MKTVRFSLNITEYVCNCANPDIFASECEIDHSGVYVLSTEAEAEKESLRKIGLELLGKRNKEIDTIRLEREILISEIEKHNTKNASVPVLSESPKTMQDGLRFLAGWFDAVYEDAGTGTDQVQQDLRRWATDAEQLQRERDEAMRLLGDMLNNTIVLTRETLDIFSDRKDDDTLYSFSAGQWRRGHKAAEDSRAFLARLEVKP